MSAMRLVCCLLLTGSSAALMLQPAVRTLQHPALTQRSPAVVARAGQKEAEAASKAEQEAALAEILSATKGKAAPRAAAKPPPPPPAPVNPEPAPKVRSGVECRCCLRRVPGGGGARTALGRAPAGPPRPPSP